MPDFSTRRLKDRRKAALRTRQKGALSPELSDVKSPAGKAERQTPLTVFKRLASDFRNGINALQKMVYGKMGQSDNAPSKIVTHERIISPERVVNTTVERIRDYRERTGKAGVAEFRGGKIRTYQNPKTSPAQVRRGFVEKTPENKPALKDFRSGAAPAVRQRLASVSDPGGMFRPVRISRSHRSLKRPLRSSSSAPGVVIPERGTYVTSADMEAARQVREQYTGELHQLPAAARVAQVLRADALIRNGEGRHNPTIHALAGAAREGRKRLVADTDTSHLQRAFDSAFGGSTRARQLLSSPAIHDMVERHRLAVESVQRRVETMERRASAKVPEISARHPQGRPAQRGRSFVRQADGIRRLPVRAATSPNQAPTGDESAHLHELRAQLSHNDFMHVPAHGERYVQEAREALSSPSSPSQAPSMPEARKHPARELPLPARSAKREAALPSSIKSAPGAAAAESSSKAESNRPQARRLTGELRMVSASGREMGRMVADIRET